MKSCFPSHSNTRLATADERKQKFLENQIVNLVEDCSADEIAPTYARLVSELQRGDYKLLDTWKSSSTKKRYLFAGVNLIFSNSLAGK